MYPCVLPYRSTRALLLAATDRAEEALSLLGYCNYDRAGKAERGDQEAARAFALRHLDRRQEADQVLAAALRLNTTRRYWLMRLGLLPTPEVNESAPS
jgi:D-serine deaminase-like pyridoxal phosphate-dependent protein